MKFLLYITLRKPIRDIDVILTNIFGTDTSEVRLASTLRIRQALFLVDQVVVVVVDVDVDVVDVRILKCIRVFILLKLNMICIWEIRIGIRIWKESWNEIILQFRKIS